MFVDQHLEHVTAGTIAIPDFQRGWVWTPDDVCKLLDSLCRGYAIGSMLVYPTGQVQPSGCHYCFGDMEIAPHLGMRKKLLLDGQQRTSALLAALYSDESPHYVYHWRLKEWRWHNGPARESDPRRMPARWARRITLPYEEVKNLYKALQQESDEACTTYFDTAQRMVQAIRQARLDVVELPLSATSDEAVEAFVRINKSGVQVTEEELRNAISHLEGQ